MEPAFLNAPLGFRGRLTALLFHAACLDCGARVESASLGRLCFSCWRKVGWLDGSVKGARAAARFEGSWRQAIHAYKFEGSLSFHRPFARVLQELSEGLLADAVVGVPSGRQALQERGYDHVEAFARPLAARLGLPYLAQALVRAREGARQARLKREERFANARGAYAAGSGAQIRGKALLLVDDVLTTGATMDACVQALLGAGAKKVERLALAAGI